MGDEPRKVIILDDDEEIQQLFRRVLRDDGFQVLVFSESQDVFDYLADEDPSQTILVFDVNLPGQHMDGPELAKRIRTELDLNIPVLFVTGSADDDVKAQVRKMGPSYDLLVKGAMTNAQLTASVNKLIRDNEMFCRVVATGHKVDSIDKKLEAIRPEAIVELMSAQHEKGCAEKRDECHAVLGAMMDAKVEAKNVISVWSKDRLAWALFIVLCSVFAAYGGLIHYTYEIANMNDKNIRVNSEVIKNIPRQMERQQMTIDEILKKVNRDQGVVTP